MDTIHGRPMDTHYMMHTRTVYRIRIGTNHCTESRDALPHAHHKHWGWIPSTIGAVDTHYMMHTRTVYRIRIGTNHCT